MTNTKPRKWHELSNKEKEVVRLKCLKSFGFFCKFAFYQQTNNKFIVNNHHRIIIDRLQDVFNGNGKKHTIFNMPPRYGKTEIIVKLFTAYCMAHGYPMEFLHLSYSKPLVLSNSDSIRDIVKSDWFIECFNVKVDRDNDSKEKWVTSSGGSFYATASGGAVTGMGAGKTTDTEKGVWRFSGALIIDDPLKPDDAYSKPKREAINNRFDNTIKSRLNTNNTPIIVVMQRIHDEDFTAMLLEHDELEFEHVVLPALIDKDGEEKALWEFKHNVEKLKLMKKQDPYTFSSQYQQMPSPLGGGIFKEEWWKYYKEEPNFKYRAMYADTALKAKEHNDYSVFQIWGVTDIGDMYLIDQLRVKLETPELEIQATAFWNKHKLSKNGVLRELCIEDKASGTGLIQTFKRKKSIPVRPIQVNKDKYTRAMDVIPFISSGHIFLKEDAEWLSDYISEHSAFTPNDTHKHDDQIDTSIHAITDIKIRKMGYENRVRERFL